MTLEAKVKVKETYFAVLNVNGDIFDGPIHRLISFQLRIVLFSMDFFVGCREPIQG